MRTINITFKDQAYSIPAYKAFEMGEAVENIATLADMARWQSNPRFHVMARCYGMMLRFAGAKVSDAEVHTEMMAQIKALQADGKDGAAPDPANLFHLQAIQSLMEVLMDGMPDALRGAVDGDEDGDGKKTPAS